MIFLAAANNYKQWNHLWKKHITYKLNTITTTQIIKKKLFRNQNSDFLIQPPTPALPTKKWSFCGPHGLCDKTQPTIRAQYLLEYCFSWMRCFGVTYRFPGWQLSTGIKRCCYYKLLLRVQMCVRKCQKTRSNCWVTFFKFTPNIRSGHDFYS